MLITYTVIRFVQYDTATETDEEEANPELAAMASPRATKSGRVSKRKRIVLDDEDEDEAMFDEAAGAGDGGEGGGLQRSSSGREKVCSRSAQLRALLPSCAGSPGWSAVQAVWHCIKSSMVSEPRPVGPLST